MLDWGWNEHEGRLSVVVKHRPTGMNPAVARESGSPG